ncbi:hypothetical protein [Thaumasiovibrio subtropicus]|uniref:hypothetical protein n=2 Tax=Thaumasiovibrio subtropicus TaxID=1891207 RepID=UPI001C8445AA|nr:hypothetical protein [Thaumasiovibrio subtropicus]
MMKVLFTLLFSLALTACAQKITAPTSGPVANLSVSVVNFNEKQSILNNEYVVFKINKKDESWGGDHAIKAEEPNQAFVIPANTELDYVIGVHQGGAGFTSNCGLLLDMVAPENKNLHLKFSLQRPVDDKKISGCIAELYADGELIGQYSGGANITIYTVVFE